MEAGGRVKESNINLVMFMVKNRGPLPEVAKDDQNMEGEGVLKELRELREQHPPMAITATTKDGVYGKEEAGVGVRVRVFLE